MSCKGEGLPPILSPGPGTPPPPPRPSPTVPIPTQHLHAQEACAYAPGFWLVCSSSCPQRTHTTSMQASSGTMGQTTTSGTALVRQGGLSLMFSKDWQPCFWVLRANKLLLFESEAAWARNPETALPKKSILLTEGLSVSPLKYKDYGGKHGPLHYFALEESMDGKVAVAAKFAATDRDALAVLHDGLDAHIKEETKRRLDYSVMVLKSSTVRERIIETVIMKEHVRASEVATASAAGTGSPSLEEPRGDAV